MPQEFFFFKSQNQSILNFQNIHISYRNLHYYNLHQTSWPHLNYKRKCNKNEAYEKVATILPI